jgi:hypothetical protein
MRSFSFGLCLLVSFAGCKHRSIASQPMHDFSTVLAEGIPTALWQAVTIEELRQQRFHEEQIYPATHPRVKRLEAWLEELHEKAAALAKDGRTVPKPQIVVVRDAVPGAYVMSLDACMDVNVSFSQGSSASRVSAAAEPGSLRVEGAKSVRAERYTSDRCLKRSLDAAQLSAVLQYAFGKMSACTQLQEQDADRPPVLDIDVGCLDEAQQEKLSGMSSASQFIYQIVPNVVVINDKMFEFAEEEVVSILAHELGHYYRLHSVADKNLYSYFYHLDARHNLGMKPRPLSKSDALSVLGHDVVSNASYYLDFAKVPGQRLHTYLFRLFQDGAAYELTRLCEEDDSECSKNCWALQSHMNILSSKESALLGMFPFAALPDREESKAYYRDYESKGLACFNQVKVKAAGMKELLNILGAGGLRNMPDEKILARYAHLGALLEGMKGTFDELIAAQNKDVSLLIHKANNQQLGYYTDEQEADEIGLELTARVGIDPQYSIDAFLKFLKISESEFGLRPTVPGTLNYEKCAASMKQGFPDFVPIADYQDIHHSTCFRAYNLYRETMAHHKELSSLPVATGIRPDDGLWRGLQKQSLP